MDQFFTLNVMNLALFQSFHVQCQVDPVSLNINIAMLEILCQCHYTKFTVKVKQACRFHTSFKHVHTNRNFDMYLEHCILLLINTYSWYLHVTSWIER